MKNYEPRLYDVKVRDLERLDSFVGDPDRLDKALDTKLDGCGDEERLVRAARQLFGIQMEQTLSMLKEGQPGYRYAQATLGLLTKTHAPGTSADAHAVRTQKQETRVAKQGMPITEEEAVVQQRQPL